MNEFIYPITLKKFEEIPSTNDYLKENETKNWTFIWTAYQSKGRGQRGSWKAKKGQNLTFSFYLMLKKLNAQNFFLLNIMICNALHKTLFTYNEDLFIKWPNDLLLKGKKIAGILIENTISGNFIQSSIIGIGLNVNQLDFSNLAKASSLKKELGIEFELEKLFKDLIKNIQKEYSLLEEFQTETLRAYYLKHLYKKGQSCLFHYKKETIKATLVGIDDCGKLSLRFEEKKDLSTFDQKEISLIY